MDVKEIDRQIAEKVMGWRPFFINKIPASWYKEDIGGLCELQYKDPKWRPSTNIAHAFEVVEKMRDLGWTFAICNNNVLEGDYCGEFWNDKHPMDAGEFMKFDNNPAMAICLAALEAATG